MTDDILPQTLAGALVRELLDCIDNLVIILDPNLRVIRANRVALVALGYPAPELVGKLLSSLIEPQSRAVLQKLVHGMAERRSDEAIFVTSSRQRLLLRFSLSPIADAGDGRLCFLLIGRLAGEVDASRIAEATNGLAQRMLKGLSDPLFVIDGPSRTVIDCNQAALAVFGCTREDVVGWRLMGHAADEKEIERNKHLMERADRAYAELGIFQERLFFPRNNGPDLPCDYIGLPFFQQDGSLSYVIAMLFDRSSEADREAELSALLDRVKALASDLASALGQKAGNEAKRLSALGFTARQIQIARLLALGYSSKEIGFRLGISESTVRNHLSVMFRKLDVDSRMTFMHVLTENRIRIA